MGADTATGAGGKHAAPLCPARLPGLARPTGAGLAQLGHGADRGPDRDSRTQTQLPTHARTRRPDYGAGQGTPRPRRDRVLGDGDATPLPEPEATTTAPPACTRPPGGPGGARPPHGALLDAGPGTGWRCGNDPGHTGRVAWDDRACSAFALGRARKQRCAQQPNAALHLPQGAVPRTPTPHQPGSLGSGASVC